VTGEVSAPAPIHRHPRNPHHPENLTSPGNSALIAPVSIMQFARPSGCLPNTTAFCPRGAISRGANRQGFHPICVIETTARHRWCRWLSTQTRRRRRGAKPEM